MSMLKCLWKCCLDTNEGICCSLRSSLVHMNCNSLYLLDKECISLCHQDHLVVGWNLEKFKEYVEYYMFDQLKEQMNLLAWTLFTRARTFMIEFMDVKVKRYGVWTSQTICFGRTSTSPTSLVASLANSIVQFVHYRVETLRTGYQTLKMSTCIELEGFNWTFCNT